jgi:hypothetical protein
MGLFTDMGWTDGQVNPSGIATELFYIPKSDIATFPVVAATPATPTANVLLVGDFGLKAGKTWFRLHSTQGKGEVTFEPIGEKECKLFMNKGKIVFPDISDAAKSHAKQSVNSSLVYIAKLPHQSEKRYVVLGDLDYDTESKISGASGGEPGSQKGLTIEVEVPCFTPLPNYAGDIVLSDGTLDCATGVFTPTP